MILVLYLLASFAFARILVAALSATSTFLTTCKEVTSSPTSYDR